MTTSTDTQSNLPVVTVSTVAHLDYGTCAYAIAYDPSDTGNEYRLSRVTANGRGEYVTLTLIDYFTTYPEALRRANYLATN